MRMNSLTAINWTLHLPAASQFPDLASAWQPRRKLSAASSPHFSLHPFSAQSDAPRLSSSAPKLDAWLLLSSSRWFWPPAFSLLHAAPAFSERQPDLAFSRSTRRPAWARCDHADRCA